MIFLITIHFCKYEAVFAVNFDKNITIFHKI